MRRPNTGGLDCLSTRIYSGARGTALASSEEQVRAALHELIGALPNPYRMNRQSANPLAGGGKDRICHRPYRCGALGCAQPYDTDPSKAVGTRMREERSRALDRPSARSEGVQVRDDLASSADRRSFLSLAARPDSSSRQGAVSRLLSRESG